MSTNRHFNNISYILNKQAILQTCWKCCQLDKHNHPKNTNIQASHAAERCIAECWIKDYKLNSLFNSSLVLVCSPSLLASFFSMGSSHWLRSEFTWHTLSVSFLWAHSLLRMRDSSHCSGLTQALPHPLHLFRSINEPAILTGNILIKGWIS